MKAANGFQLHRKVIELAYFVSEIKPNRHSDLIVAVDIPNKKFATKPFSIPYRSRIRGGRTRRKHFKTQFNSHVTIHRIGKGHSRTGL